MSDARLFAIRSLGEVGRKSRRPRQVSDDIALSLDKRDRAFHMEIVYGVLRYRYTLDWILGHFLKNPGQLDDFTRNNLRIAVYQIFFMRVPEWAAINESVEIQKTAAPHHPGNRKTALVNAVLRNILRQKERFSPPFQIDDPVESMAINTSHPEWLIRRWIERLGSDDALLFAMANNTVHPFSLRTNTLKISRTALLDVLEAHGIAAQPTSFSPDGITLKDMVTYADLAFIHGLFGVQDEASQLITYLLDPQPGERILDACAAPGGKTAHLAQRIHDTGEIIAVEKDPKRIISLQENITLFGIRSVQLINADMNDLGIRDTGTFDKILVDAPCSSLGVIRKNPDVKYKCAYTDLLNQGKRQLSLLTAASRLLAENGRLVYSVCSTEPEEGELVVREFLKTATDFRIIEEVRNDILFPFMDRGMFRTHPYKYTMDGFFGVALCRNR